MILIVRKTQLAKKNIPKTKCTSKDILGAAQLDARFRAIPRFTALKHFKSFSHMKQWTGDKRKAVLQVLLSVIVLLLEEEEPNTLIYAQAMTDFVTIAQYSAYDEGSIKQLEQALEII